MKIVRFAFRSCHDGLSRQFQRTDIVRTLSTNATPGSGVGDKQTNSFESADEFERRIFGDLSGGNSKNDIFFEKLDRVREVRDRPGSRMGEGSNSRILDGLDESFNTLSDGMDGKLKKAATYFEFDEEEIAKDDYAFRPDMTFRPEMTYEMKDLDLTKAGVRKPFKRLEFEVTTEEVLRKADFRNVRFLANFITEAGIIIKRSKTRISAKAQRKVAREIKTARAFGLMPFTTMGTKSFVFGKTMEALDEDFEYETYDSHSSADADAKDPLGA
uniref:Small ribosomal subunit protein bS18c n=1 Tax=Fagus sylvatica TaxID=28930 RepID=A0A2N9HMY4_FAGSY